LQKQAAIQKQIPDLATRFSYKQASVASSAMGCSIPAAVVRLMVCADRIIGANPQALQSAPKNMRKSGSGRDETAQCPLGGCDRERSFARIDQAGLLWLLNGNRLVAVTKNTATIETRSGARQTYRRKPSGPSRVLGWELARNG
jgi:hypothetical protein